MDNRRWRNFRYYYKKQDTDLDKGKDKVTIKIKLNGEVEEVEGTIKAEYDLIKMGIKRYGRRE